MIQAKFSMNDIQLSFLNKYKNYGFKDKSSMVRTAVDYYRKKIELEKLRESAELYSEIYETEDDLKELTEISISGWPE